MRIALFVLAYLLSGVAWGQWSPQWASSPGGTPGSASCPGPGGITVTAASQGLPQCTWACRLGTQAYCLHEPAPPGSCGANATFNGTTCTCNANYTRSGDACVPVNNCVAGSTSNSGFYNVGTSPAGAPPRAACSSGCEVTYSGGGASRRAMVNGQWNYFAEGFYARTGQQCQSGDTRPNSTAALPAPSCGPNQSYGQINGVDVCVNNTTQRAENPNADTKSQSTTVNTTVNANGGTTTTETTTGSDGRQTVTTTNRDGSGNVTGRTVVESNVDPLDDFCKANPSSPLCSKSIWTGACGTGFTCEGDAATCAIARAAALMRCEEEKTGPAVTLGQQIVDGADPATLPNPANPTAIPVGTIDESGWLSRSCLSDQTFPIGWGGVSITIPWSQLCTALEAMGMVLVMAAFMSAAMIVGVRPT